MLINQENIQQRFNENLEWATGIDLATAWATPGAGLRSLQARARARPFEIRAVVGLWNKVTKPDALTDLADIGELHTVDESRNFHPKIYVFRGPVRSVAWIGSSNFTARGFGMNEEVLFETSDTEAVERWFHQLWEQCGPLDEAAIAIYAESYAESRANHPPRPAGVDGPKLSHTPMQLLEGVDDWKSYVSALKQCNQWWKGQYEWSVLEEQYSWSETIQDLNSLVNRPNWRTLTDDDKKRLLGIRKDSWALLGRMRPKALKTVFDHNCEEMQNAVRLIGDAADADFPRVAIEAYETLTGLKEVGSGIATRLLTLARPDRFVSLNGKSAAGLAKSFGLARSTLGKPRNYGSLLEKICSQTWFREPAPKDAHEETICWMRAALLDCFVYDPGPRWW